MRSHGKNIEKSPGLGEMLALIDERQDLQETKRTSIAIQEILGI